LALAPVRVEQPPFTYIHDGYNTSACPQCSASAHLRMASLPFASTAAGGNPAFPLHARSLPASNSLLGALSGLAESGLVSLVKVLDLELLAVLSQQSVCLFVSPVPRIIQPDLLRRPSCISRVYAPPTWRTSAQTRHASQQ
jgi:hypothetical protein